MGAVQPRRIRSVAALQCSRQPQVLIVWDDEQRAGNPGSSRTSSSRCGHGRRTASVSSHPSNPSISLSSSHLDTGTSNQIRYHLPPSRLILLVGPHGFATGLVGLHCSIPSWENDSEHPGTLHADTLPLPSPRCELALGSAPEPPTALTHSPDRVDDGEVLTMPFELWFANGDISLPVGEWHNLIGHSPRSPPPHTSSTLHHAEAAAAAATVLVDPPFFRHLFDNIATGPTGVRGFLGTSRSRPRQASGHPTGP